MPPDLKTVFKILAYRREEMADAYGVAEIDVFGSVLRGENTEASDVDILVAFDRPIGFFKFLELEEKLSGWLGAKVDLVTRDALKPNIGRRILDEVAVL